MVVIAFRYRKSVTARVRWGLALSFHKHWSRGQSKVVIVRNDNGFQDVPLIPWPINIALNSDQIHFAIVRNTSLHHHRTTVKRNGFLAIAGGIGGIWFPPHTGSFVSHVQRKAAVIDPTNLSPRCSSPSGTTPNVLLCVLVSEGRLVVSWLGTQQSSVDVSLKGPVGNPVISPVRAAGKGTTSNKS